MPIATQHLDGRLRHAGGHEVSLFHGRDEMISIASEKQSGYLDRAEPLPNVVGPKDLQPADVTFTSDGAGAFQKTRTSPRARCEVSGGVSE